MPFFFKFKLYLFYQVYNIALSILMLTWVIEIVTVETIATVIQYSKEATTVIRINLHNRIKYTPDTGFKDNSL